MYIQIYQLHGLIRSKNLELGIDDDTGGQIIYAIELAKALAELDDVSRVEIVTRKFKDTKYKGYDLPLEQINEKLAIVRVPCGPSRYLKKVELRKYLSEFYDNIEYYIESEDEKPDIIHSNYVDAGYICNKLSHALDIPHVFTAHSLGKPKMEDLQSKSANKVKLDDTFDFSKRIEVEQDIISSAQALIISCEQEIQEQFSKYNVKPNDKRFKVLLPGVNIKRFKPFWTKSVLTDEKQTEARKKLEKKINAALDNPEKPPVLMLSRLEAKKNIPNMVECYADYEELQKETNLIICAGKITNPELLSNDQVDIINQIKNIISKNNLEGKILLFDEVDYETEVPELFRIVGRKRGIFVDCDITDPLPLTIIEAALSGIPVVANNLCALLNIITKGKSELLINVRKHNRLSEAILKLVHDKELWDHCAKAGVDSIMNDLTWDISARKALQIYKEIIET